MFTQLFPHPSRFCTDKAFYFDETFTAVTARDVLFGVEIVGGSATLEGDPSMYHFRLSTSGQNMKEGVLYGLSSVHCQTYISLVL